MNKNEELPDGITDLGEGKGFAINMEYLQDKEGNFHVPPTNLSKEQTLQWIQEHHNGKKKNA